MRPRRVLVFVEGVSDTRFFDRVIAPLIRPAELRTVEYACMLKKEVNKRLRAERSIGNPVLFVAGQDLSPCAGKRKAKSMEAHPALEERQIIVVSREIESWYMAGINDECARSLGVGRLHARTDDRVKDDFHQLIPRTFSSKDDFMLEILKQYDVQLARTRNSSFDYLFRRIEALTAQYIS